VGQARWRVAAASVRGAGHEKAGLPCQDAHKWVAVPGAVLITAVADGAGSAPLAEVGATVAATTAVESACEKVRALSSPSQLDDPGWERLLTETLSEAKTAVESAAAARSVASSDLASTLIVVVAGADFVAAVQIGDGAVISAKADGVLVCVTSPPPGEYLNETTFLTASEALPTARAVVWRGHLSHLAVISDGLQMAALRMPAAQPHPGFFEPLFRFLGEQSDGDAAQAMLTSFLASARLRERTEDDVTLVLATLVS
jgi:hypothetical protein